MSENPEPQGEILDSGKQEPEGPYVSPAGVLALVAIAVFFVLSIVVLIVLAFLHVLPNLSSN